MGRRPPAQLLDLVNYSRKAYDRGVELRDEQPAVHEIGNRRYLIAPVEPLDVDGVRTVQVGTALFLVAFIGLLPFYGRLEEDDRTWLLWMCLTGVGLGLLGVEYCKRRRAFRIERDQDA
jgi:hypothetical protein